MKRLYQSVREEYPTPTPGNVTGTIPDWLDGSLYRNGPGLFEVGTTKYNHWFDGMAVLQRFHVTKQEVTYQRRFLQSETYKKNMAAKRIAVTEFATTAFPDPCKGSIARAVSFVTETAEPTDNTNVNIHILGGEMYTSSESNILHRLNPQTLETQARVVLTDHIPINMAAAHAHRDWGGALHSIGYQFGKGRPKYCLIRTPVATNDEGGYSKSRLVASVMAEHSMHPSYFHSFGMTENYYVFVEQPMLINVWKILAAMVKKHHMLQCIQWDPEYTGNLTRFHVIDRRTGNEVNAECPYVADAFLVLHHINAFEDQGQLVVDVCGFHVGDILDKFDMDRLNSDKAEEVINNLPRPHPWRYVLPLEVDINSESDSNLVTLPDSDATAVMKKKKIFCTYQPLSTESMDLPIINYSMVNGRKYRYMYGIGLQAAPGNQPTIFKVDINEKTTLKWCEDGCFPSEAIFVPRPSASREDDGMLLSVVGTIGEDQEDFLLILDAGTLQEVARVVFPGIRFPKDQHGVFLDGQ
ncbi:carotenoid-cleaving dioxygenase, mitochondrial-like [Haliotis cracherodii]|uniref:carotenoid-cleaving dioxygenase, mitochondrial-like n=1 Tax=Haliotis cracherodii TaxID=6455 RepID=UPI0039E75987